MLFSRAETSDLRPRKCSPFSSGKHFSRAERLTRALENALRFQAESSNMHFQERKRLICALMHSGSQKECSKVFVSSAEALKSSRKRSKAPKSSRRWFKRGAESPKSSNITRPLSNSIPQSRQKRFKSGQQHFKINRKQPKILNRNG